MALDAAKPLVRISKRMSELGWASRREADAWIEAGLVKVNGRTVCLGEKMRPDDNIVVERAARREQQERVTILMHKPVGYVSGQAEDGYLPARVLVTPENRWGGDLSKRRFSPSQLKSLVPAGRLDIDSVGLLVLTQDGRVAKTLIDASSTVEKEYIVRVCGSDGQAARKALSEKGLALLNHGLTLDGKSLLPAKVSWLNESELRFVLQEGKKRQIRRMCEAVGLRVLRLKRVRIGKVTLGKLPYGKWRYLSESEHF